MIIAVACDGLFIPNFFSRATSFTFYEVSKGVIRGSRNVPLTEFSPERYPEILETLGASSLICSQIGQEAEDELRKRGIDVVCSLSFDPSTAVRDYLNRTLYGEAAEFA